MPHDYDGEELKVGDHVLVPCVVVSVSPGATDFCNVTLETRRPCFPGTQPIQVSLNARQVVKEKPAVIPAR